MLLKINFDMVHFLDDLSQFHDLSDTKFTIFVE